MDEKYYQYMVSEVIKDFSESSLNMIITSLYNLRDDVESNENFTMKNVKESLDYIIKFSKNYEEFYQKLYKKFGEVKEQS